jgi:AcrR family transcriptional regulator
LKNVSIVLRPAMKSTFTEERILRETGAMFFRHGIRTITMDDIASNLGISKKTIYLYYRDKSELVKSFTEGELHIQEKDMHSIHDKSTDAVEEMMLTTAHVSSFFQKVNPTVFYDLQKYHPASWEAFKKFKEKILITIIEENLKRGIAEGLYRKEIKVKILARLRMEEVELAFNPLIFPPDKFKLTEVHLSIIDHFLHGIVTMKGYKLIDRYKKLIKK